MNRKEQLVATCKEILDGKNDIIEKCRQIVDFGTSLGIQNNEYMKVFIGVVSETDDLPDGKLRNNFNYNYLENIDTEIEVYVGKVFPSIKRSCEGLIKEYGTF